MLRFLLWRLLGLLAVAVGFALVEWFLAGGPGRVLRGLGSAGAFHLALPALPSALEREARGIWSWAPRYGIAPARMLAALAALLAVVIVITRWVARHRRQYVRLGVEPYRTDRASAEAIVTMFEVLHKRMLRRWWRRLLFGQPSLSLEVHHARTPPVRTAIAGDEGSSRASLYVGGLADHGSASASPHVAWLAVTCPHGLERMVEAALRTAYQNCRLRPIPRPVGTPPVVLRLKKNADFVKRVKVLDHFEHEREPPVNRLLTAMGACGEPAFTQIAITPAPLSFERLAKRIYKRREAALSRKRREHRLMRDRSMVEDAELRGGLDLQHRPLFFVDLRVVARDRGVCERIASELRSDSAENRLVERGTGLRHGLLGLYSRRVQRGEGNPMASFHKGVFAPTELAALWHLPSPDYMTVPCERSSLPLAPAPPSILRPAEGPGTLRDALGAVSIHPELRKQNTAVPGAVEQGKSSYLVATVAEDLRRERCAVIVLDPKGDAADAAVSLVPASRTCTLLDLSRPTCGFNPLAVDAPADVIADYVVAALKNLFTDADIRASSDRYLRNAIIAVLASRPRIHVMGRGTPSVGWRGGLLLPPTGRGTGARIAGVQGDLRVLHRRACGATGRRAEHDDGQARRARQQARAAAQLVLDQASAAQRLAASRFRPRDRRRRGAGREGGARGYGRRQHLGADAVARRDAGRSPRSPAGPRAGARPRGGRAQGRRGPSGPEPRLRRDDGAQAVRGAGDRRVLADGRAVGRPRRARPARRAVRSPSLFRDRLHARRARRGRADDGRVLRYRAPWHSTPLRARSPGRSSASTQAPRDRELVHSARTSVSIHRADDPAAGRSRASGASCRAPDRAWRTPSHRPSPATLGSCPSRDRESAAAASAQAPRASSRWRLRRTYRRARRPPRQTAIAS